MDYYMIMLVKFPATGNIISEPVHVPLIFISDTVRLVNGSVDGWGELQYWSGGQWSAVCTQGWDTEDTTVVCTHLGYPS